MQTEKSSLIDLKAFRKKNGLFQQDVADFLGLSRGYISMVEKGKSKLSKINIQNLFDSHNKQHWDTRDLVPAYTRLDKALDYIDSSPELNLEKRKTSEEIRKTNESKIKFCVIDITEPIADTVIELCPDIDKEWLLTGKGEMIKIKETEEPFDLKASLRRIEQKLDFLTKAIGELRY